MGVAKIGTSQACFYAAEVLLGRDVTVNDVRLH